MNDREKERVRQAFAARFRQALEELEIGPAEQKRLQRLFGVSGQAVRKWAEGLSMPTTSRMPLVAEILGVRRGWLQDGEGPMRPGSAVAEEPGKWGHELALTEEEVRLLTRFRMLRSEQRAALETILHAFANTPANDESAEQ